MVISTIHQDPAADLAENRRQIKEVEEKARRARPGDPVQHGYLAFMGRRHSDSLVDLLEARHEEIHRSMWVEDFEGAECTACACGVLVEGRVGRDFTEAEFQIADGHLPYTEPEQDPTVCPRCGHGLPNDRTPGSGTGFWSLATRKAYVCAACYSHQKHLHYSPRNLGVEVWPVRVPKRFYDEAWWPRHQRQAGTSGIDGNGGRG